MNDTSKEIRKIQFEILNKRSDAEKIKGLLDLTELSRKIILDQLHQKNPEMTENNLKVELFRIFYKDDFKPEKLDEISEFLRKAV
jgi:hypothetical protein